MSFDVKKVVFYEDRACVIREHEVKLNPGVHSFEIENLSPFIIDKSVMLDSSNDDVQLCELLINRTFVGDSLAEKVIARERDELKEIVRAREVLNESISNLEKSRVLLLKKIASDVAIGISEAEKWHDSLEKINQKQNDTISRLQNIKDEIHEKELLMSDKKLAQNLDSPDWRSSVKVSIECRSETKVTLTLRYLTAAACWRPCNDAFINGNNLNFKLCARLWQNTGEVWENFNYELSTERLSMGGELPPIITDWIYTEKKPPARIAVTEKSRKTDVEIIQVDEIPGIDDNGQKFTASSGGKISFPATEQSIKVSYWQFNSEVSSSLIAYPMLSEYVNEVITFFNYGEIPILDSPVSIYRNNVLMGQSLIKYKAPGEKIELDCGSIPEILIKRKIKREKKTKVMSFWRLTENTLELYISNLSSDSITFELKERVPVSETEKVIIDVNGDKSKPASFPDKEGIISWKVTCPPHGRKKIVLNYTIKIHKDTAGVTIPV